jgi:hypothetical protein
MEWVPQILQFPVVVEGGRPSSIEPQVAEKLGLLLGGIAAQGRISKEFFQPRIWLQGSIRLPFNKLESLRILRGQHPVQDDLHAEGRQVDVPGFNQRIQE